MRAFALLLFLHSASVVQDRQPGVHFKTNLNHTLAYSYTATAGVNTSTKVVGAGLIDGNPFYRYDNDSWSAEGKPVWMRKLVANPFWENQTRSQVDSLRDIITIAKRHFNQSAESYAVQLRVGCERDGQTGEVKEFHKYGYDGKDFIVYDLERAWIAKKWPDALKIQHKWNHNRAAKAQIHQFLTKICPEWLQNNSLYLERIELPSVFLLQKTPSSPITCMATGFYPDRAALLWRKDGEELHEGVKRGETLPNHDGSFQIRAHLDPPPDEDWQRYECVFSFSGVKKDVITRLDKAAVRSNSGSDWQWTYWILIIVVSLLVCFTIGVLVWKKERLRGTSSATETPVVSYRYGDVSTRDPDSPSRGNEKSDLQVTGDLKCLP